MFQQEKKYLSGGLNTDDAPFAVGPSELINAVNLRFGTTENGAVGYLESVPGNSLIVLPLPVLGVNITIGSAVDEEADRIIIFNYEGLGSHGIYAYYPKTNLSYKVLLGLQVTGGLNFSFTRRINRAIVVAGVVYWTDNNNEPRRINIDAGIKTNHPGFVTDQAPYILTSGIDSSVITLIKKTINPVIHIRKVRSLDVPAFVDFNLNFLADNAFQFAARYIYRDNEYSVISQWSKLAAYGFAGEEALNVLEIVLSGNTEQDVFAIELIVRFGNFGNAFVIKTWDKDRDVAEMATGTLKHYFLNDSTGIAIDQAALAKPFESIPLKAKAICPAKNRLFLGNNLFGYNSPTTTSLDIQDADIPSAGNVGTWYYITATGIYTAPPSPYEVTGIYLDLGPSVIDRYLYIKWVDYDFYNFLNGRHDPDDPVPTPADYDTPATIFFSDITSRYSVLNDLIPNFFADDRTDPTRSTFNSFTTGPSTASGPASISGSTTSSSGLRPLKSNSSYRMGIVFYDKYRRKCGVVTRDDLKRTIPMRTWDQVEFTNILSWNVANTNAINEIPDWAHYYQIVRTKNLTTQYFIQGGVNAGATYVTKDDAGEYVFTEGSAGVDVIGSAFKINELLKHGIGYTYAEGDLLSLIFTATGIVQNVSVIGQHGDWIITSLLDLGSSSGANSFIYEIYTPYKESVNEGYFEIGECYPIHFPGLPGRQYSVLNGTINGDAYTIVRLDIGFGNYTVEAMSPNDKYWKNWYSDIGWFSIVDRIGQQQRVNNIAFSNVLIPGTRSNGLAAFDALDSEDVPIESGELNSLIISAKAQDEGTVMLAICKNQTLSVYLGEHQILDTSGNVFTASSDKVIGTINLLKGSFGTAHPESVIAHMGNVMWFDVNSGAVVQYSTNGLFPISSYKMNRFFSRYSKKYLASGKDDPVIGGIDPYNNEYLITVFDIEGPGFPQKLPTLEDRNEFNVYDGMYKTFGFKLGMQRFISSYWFWPEHYENIGMQLYCFTQGTMWKNNDITVTDNHFFGTQQTTKLMFLSNSNPTKLKIFSNIAIEGNMAPKRCIFYALNPNMQITDLYAEDFVLKEGTFYAEILRDRLSPNVVGTAEERMYIGDKIRAYALMCQIEFDTTVEKLQLKMVNIGHHIAAGHTV
jgi:hypothetical protein